MFFALSDVFSQLFCRPGLTCPVQPVWEVSFFLSFMHPKKSETSVSVISLD